MLRRFRALIPVVLFLSVLTFPALSKEASLAERLDAIVAASVPADAPGVAVIVVQDGKTLLRKGYGLADLERNVPITPETIFRIGSITKQYTAVAVLQLVKEGKVGLDDPLSKYVPDFPNADKVTVRHLLTHTSGIKSYTNVPSFMQHLREDKTPLQVVEAVRNEPADFAPGEKWLYNNSGYIFLGIIIEKASGMPYAEYMQKKLFTPLGLTHTFVGDENRVVRGRAQGYEQDAPDSFRHARYVSMTQPYAAGAIESNVDDLAKWNALLLSGKVIDADLLKLAWTDSTTSNGKPTGYGFGWQISDEDGVRYIEHGGGIMGFVSHGTLVPEKKVYVALLHNSLGTEVEAAWLANRIASEVLGKPWNTTAIAMSQDELKQYTGVYDFDGVKRTVTFEDGKLHAQRDGGPKSALVPVAKDRLHYEKSFTSLAFERNAAGELASVTFNSRGQATAKGKRAADAPAPKKEITLGEAVLAGYVGVYELGPGFSLTVTREGTRLFMQATGQGRAEAFAESETKFFLKVVEAAIVFTPGPDGKATTLTLHQGGREMPAKRVE